MLTGGDTSDEVYVLSLPGFVFFKAPGRSTKRAAHSCVVVGKRQLLSVGGTDGSLGFPNSLLDPDPWRQGLGVFDMTRMAWSDGYRADAEAYDSPAIVREWYAQGGLKSVTWASPELERLFTFEPIPSPGTPSDQKLPPAGGDGSGSAPGSSPTGSSAPVGAIVGGVVGGVAALALVGLAIWFMRRRRTRQSAIEVAPAEVKYVYTGNWKGHGVGTAPQELEGNSGASELPARHGYSEVGTSMAHGQVELPGSTAGWNERGRH